MCAEPIEGTLADADYSAFFLDPKFQARYPGITLPPPSFVASGARILFFEAGRSIKLVFPVREHQLNPIGTLQGGILCSFFDAAYCVHKTALGALNRGYKVTVVDDALMTRKNLSDVLKQYEKDGIPTITSGKMIAM